MKTFYAITHFHAKTLKKTPADINKPKKLRTLHNCRIIRNIFFIRNNTFRVEYLYEWFKSLKYESIVVYNQFYW